MIVDSWRERPYPMVSQDLALKWYLDSDSTTLVVMGARVLDWYSWTSGQMSDEGYQRRLALSADDVRHDRDGHRDMDAKSRVEHGWATLEALHDRLTRRD